MEQKSKKKNKIIQFLSKNTVLIIFIVFFALVLLQHHFVWLYHDDFGYASLSYEYNVSSVVGHTFNIQQLLEFLLGHYRTWGGRILYFGIECFLVSKSLSIFRIVQSIVITLIFYYIYKIVSKNFDKKYEKLIALLSVSLYGIIEIIIARFGIFWFTASVLYVFPILPLLMFSYYYDYSNKKIYYIILMSILIFIASFSQEQVSVAAVSYIGLMFLINIIKNKKINKNDIIFLISSLIGFGILMLSPGSKVRMNHPSNNGFYELGLFEKLQISIPNLVEGFFNNYSKIFLVLFLITVTYMTISNLKMKNLKIKQKKIIKVIDTLNLISFVSNLVICYFTIFTNKNYFCYFNDMFQLQSIKTCLIIIYILQLLLMIYSITLFFVLKENIQLLFLTYAAVLSQAAMLMSAYYPLRSVLVFYFLFFVIIIFCVIDLLKKYKIKLDNRIMKSFILCFILLSFTNYYTITRGYFRNDYFNKENDKILTDCSRKIKNGENITEIKLHKMNDITYSGEQAYTPGQEYMLEWIYEYYDLPSNVNLVYE